MAMSKGNSGASPSRWVNSDHVESEVLRTPARDAARSEDELREAVIAELFPFIRYLESLYYKESTHGFRFASSMRGCMLAREIKDMLLNDAVVRNPKRQEERVAAAREDAAFQSYLAGMMPKRARKPRKKA